VSIASDRRRRVRLGAAPLIVGAAFLVLVPTIVAAVAIVRPQWYPTGDMAQAELHVRGFWSHPPLVGAAGRIVNRAGVQGSHPGPLLWLAMWPIYALGGSTSTALVVSIVVVHLATMALALWIAVRRGGIGFGIALAGVMALIVHAGGPEVFTEPWNPWMGLLPFLVLLLASWSVLDGERWALVLAVAAGTYCVQAHTGYVLVVGGLLALLVATVVVRAVRASRAAEGDSGGRTLMWLGIAVLAGVVLWIPPLLDQLRRDPGNMSILVDNFTHPDAPYLTFGKVAEVSANQFNLVGPWLVGAGRDGVDALTVVGLVGFLALWAAAIVHARRRQATSQLHLHAVLGIAALLGVVSVSRIFGLYLEYTVRWLWIITGTVVAASVTELLHGVSWSARARRGAVVAASTVAIVGLVVAAIQFADRAGPTGAIDSRIVGGLVPEIEPGLDPATPYLVRWHDPSTLGALGFGVVLELERRGFHVGVDQQFAAAALPHRVLPEASAGGVLYVVSGDGPIERARATPGVTELGSFDVRTPAQRARSDELRRELEQALVASGRADKLPLLDSQYGQAQLRFANPPLPSSLQTPLDEYISLRLPAAVFLAAPFDLLQP
jgi:hypothetical protein